jgi:NitT/TauT family transport system substrate-binding protein
MLLAPIRPGFSRRRAAVSRARVAVTVAAAAVLVASCQSQAGTSQGAVASGHQQLTVGVVPGPDTAPLDVSVQKGLFRQHGVTVMVKTYGTLSQEISALTSGRIDVAEGDYSDFLYKSAHGTPLRLIADGYDAAPNTVAVLTLPDSGINSPQNLAGKIIATPSPQAINVPARTLSSGSTPYSIEQLATESVLTGQGVSPSSIHWQPMPMKNMIGALSSRRVNAILVTEPYIIEAETQLGATQVLDACSGVTSGLPLSGYFSLTSFTSRHAEALRAFQSALFAGQSASAMRGPVQAVLHRSAGVSVTNASLVTLGTYPTFLNVGQVQRIAQLMYDAGVTTNLVNVKAMAFG